MNSTKEKLTKTVFISRKNDPNGLKYRAAVEQSKNDDKDINDYFGIKAFHLSLGKDEHASRKLSLIPNKQSNSGGDKNEICEIIHIEVTYVTDTWQNDYSSYLARDYGAPSYLGATINHVYDNYRYCYNTDGTYTIVTDIDSNGGIGPNGNSSGNGNQGTPIIGPNDRVPFPCLENTGGITMGDSDGFHGEETIANLKVNFGHPTYTWHVELNIPVLCVSVFSENHSFNGEYVINIIEQTLFRTFVIIQQQYREGEFDHVLNTGLLNQEFSQIFRAEAEDITPHDITVNLDMNNLCSNFSYDTNVPPATISWDC